MLAASTGAIPIYFGMMQYLGFAKTDASFFARVGIVPPLLFLLAAATFVLGLRPIMADLDESEFEEIRRRRIKSLNGYMTVGTTVFVAATLLTIVLSFRALL
jgi:hypothetical protein